MFMKKFAVNTKFPEKFYTKFFKSNLTFGKAAQSVKYFADMKPSRRRSPDCIRISLNPLKKVVFNVSVGDLHLTEYQNLALVTDSAMLNGWNAQKAELLQRTSNPDVWRKELSLSESSEVRYRYLIVALDSARDLVQVDSWETHITARSVNVASTNSVNDTFGYIDEGPREVQVGWLDSNTIVQFKIFPNALSIDEGSHDSLEDLRLKVQPVEAESRRPIFPSAQAETHYARMEYGNSFFSEQKEFGEPYALADTWLIQSTVASLENTAFTFKLYFSPKNSDVVDLIGFQHVTPKNFTSYEGELDIKLVSPVLLNLVARLQVQYLVIHPTLNIVPDLTITLVDYWPEHWKNLHVGHRGLGCSLKVRDNAATIPENTIGSMKAANALFADLVEFDVMLTKDMVPIIFHDFDVHTCKVKQEPQSAEDLTKVPVKDFDYNELKALTFYVVRTDGSIQKCPPANSILDGNLHNFPRLEDAFKEVDKALGFNIEFKWPQLKWNGEWESKQTMNKNDYVDCILQTVVQHAAGRLIFFSSFDPDMCVMLRYKQCLYPVMFLSAAISQFADPRSRSVRDSINHAQAFDLMGVVWNSAVVVNDPENIKLATAQNKKVFLWGDDLKDAASVNYFLSKGVSGVIYDRIDRHLPQRKQRAYVLEKNLDDMLQLRRDSIISCECKHD